MSYKEPSIKYRKIPHLTGVEQAVNLEIKNKHGVL